MRYFNEHLHAYFIHLGWNVLTSIAKLEHTSWGSQKKRFKDTLKASVKIVGIDHISSHEYFNCTQLHVYENTSGYLKNHWTKRRIVCDHFDVHVHSTNSYHGHDSSNFWNVFKKICWICHYAFDICVKRIVW